MAPNFLSQQIAWSLRNTGLRTVDIYYLQNPETQLPFVDRTTFRRRLQLAFARLEEEVAAGRIGCYGIATWDGFRLAPVDKDVHEPGGARAPGGRGRRREPSPARGTIAHQPGMLEALTLRNQPVRNSILAVPVGRARPGLRVVASAALGQGQFATPHGRSTRRRLSRRSHTTDQRSLQLVRSLPGRHVGALRQHRRGSTCARTWLCAAQPPDPAAALRLAHMKGQIASWHTCGPCCFDMGDTIVDLGEGRGKLRGARDAAGRPRVRRAGAPGASACPAQDEPSATLLAHDSEAQYQAALAQQIGIDAPDGHAPLSRRRKGCRPTTTSSRPRPRRTAAAAPSWSPRCALGAVETLTALKASGLAPRRDLEHDPARPLPDDEHAALGLDRASSTCGCTRPTSALPSLTRSIFQVALEALGVAAEDAVYVGDRLVPDVGGRTGGGDEGRADRGGAPGGDAPDDRARCADQGTAGVAGRAAGAVFEVPGSA